MTKNFIIYDSNIEKAKIKLDKLKLKAKKYDLPLAYSIIPYEMVKRDGLYYQTYFVVVNYKPIGINGYKPIALLEKVSDNNNLIYSFGDVIIDNRYKNVSLTCNHCNTKHERKYAVLVENTKTNEILQVGKACLKEYTGYYDADKLIRFYESIEEFTIEGNCGGYNTQYYNTQDIIKLSYEVMEENDFVYISRDKSNELGIESTRDTVLTKIEKYEQKYNDNDYQLVKDAFNWINDNNTDVTSEYLSNIKTLVNTEYIEYKHVGFVVSFINAYKNHLKRLQEIETKKETINSEYQGTPKERLKDLHVTLNYFTWWQNDFGTTYIYIFSDNKGNVYTWKTNKWLGGNSDDITGLEIDITGTVKEHTEYKGTKQTVLTRCKVA